MQTLKSEEEYVRKTLKRKFQLPNIRIEIGIPSAAKYTSHGAVGWVYNAAGECTIKYDEETGLHQIITQWLRDKDSTTELYRGGHEEGHAILLLGQSELLCKSLVEKGYSFDFFTIPFAQRLDNTARHILDIKRQLIEQDFLALGDKRYHDLIADCGGLHSLISNTTNSEDVRYLYQRLIKRESPPHFPNFRLPDL